MAKHPDVNYYRHGKNPQRKTLVWQDAEGNTTVHVADLARGRIVSFTNLPPDQAPRKVPTIAPKPEESG